MTFFGDPIALLATGSLIIQVIVLYLLVYGYMLRRKLEFAQHGKVMQVAVTLHLVIIFFVMVPSFAASLIPKFVVHHPSSVTTIIALIHAPLGVIAVSLGLWLVLSWRSQGLKSCFKRRKFMVTALTVWVIALALGIALYFVLYWSALVG